MQKTIFILCLVLYTNFIKANDSTLNFTLKKKLEGNFKNFEVDNFGNYYLITPNNQIIKLNDKFDTLAYFAGLKYLGNIHSVDVSNPLKILVLYKGFSTIVLLDRLLAPLNTIQLQKLNMFDVSFVTSSYDNNIWLYDEIDNKIKRIDFDGKILSESIDFRQIFTYKKNFACQFIKDYEGKLYLYSSLFGLFVFDYYGGLINRHQITDLFQPQLIGLKLIGLKNDFILQYNTTNKSEIKKSFLEKEKSSFKKVIFSKTQTLILGVDDLKIYDSTIIE